MLFSSCENAVDNAAVISTTVSPKYQIVISREVRDAPKLRPGQKLEVIPYDNRIELVPLQETRALRGSLKDIDSEVPRDEDRV